MPGFPRNLVVVLVAVVGIGCSAGVDLDEVPVGADVQLTREDGGLVEGRLLDRTPERVTVDEGLATREVPRDAIADVRVVADGAEMPPPPPSATYREVTLPSGTAFQLELTSPVDTGTSQAGDTVSATLAADVTVNEMIVLPAGSNVSGRVEAVEAAGNVKGRASLSLAFTSVAVGGEAYPIDAGFRIVAPATKAEDAKKIGIPAAGGAVLGAILGGGKGAAVGAAVGGGAGTAVVLMTPGDEVRLPVGTTLSVTLDEPVDVKVPIRASIGRPTDGGI
jgi:hypothetical protein